MSKKIEMTGKRFGRLTVVKESHRGQRYERFWECVCDCGNTKVINGSSLRHGITKSCGCLSKELASKRSRTHGMTRTKLFNTWQHMRRRCQSKSVPSYSRYGGRGISVCKEWDESFIAFRDWAMANGYRDDLSIDRIDVNGNYEPSNCRWATMEEQSLNKRETIYIEYKGETKPLLTWCKEFGLKYASCYERHRAHPERSGEYVLFGDRKRVSITYDGETKYLTDWCREYGLKYTTCLMRLRQYGVTDPGEILFGKKKGE